MSLGVVTQYAVSDGLPADTFRLNWHPYPGDATVRIGIPDAWTADIVLDRLESGLVRFKLLRHDIFIRRYVECLDPCQRTVKKEMGLVRLEREQRKIFHQFFLGDCMVYRAEAAAASGKSRTQASLFILSTNTTQDFCGLH